MSQASTLEQVAKHLRKGDPIPENLLVQIGGAHLYYCRTDNESATFDGGDVGRIGLIFVVPEFDAVGRERLALYGLRIGSTKNGTEYRPDIKEWSGEGELSVAETAARELQISYVLHDSNGDKLAGETLSSAGGSGDWQGTFTAFGKAGELIKGSVRHIRWSNRECVAEAFAGFPLRYGSFLPAAIIAQWGDRLYQSLDERERANEDFPVVLIDVVSERHVRTTPEAKWQALHDLKAYNPHPAVYEATLGAPTYLSVGVGPLR